MFGEDPKHAGNPEVLVDDMGLRAIEQLEAFRQISAAVGSKNDLGSVISLIGDKTSQIMRAERTSVFLAEDGGGTPCLKSIVADGCETITVQFGQGIAGHCAQTRRRINVKDAYQSPLFDDSFDKRHGFRTRSCLTSPIFDFGGALVGVIQVINKRNGAYFSHVDEDMIESICAQIGVTLAQHRHYLDMIAKNTALRAAQASLKRRNAELDMLYDLERKAASAPDLDELMRLMLQSCAKAFDVRAALAVIEDDSGYRLFSITAADKNAQSNDPGASFEKRRLNRLPTFLSAVIKIGECMRLLAAEIETLPKQSEASFGYGFQTVLIAPLSKEDDLFGALILGSEICCGDVFAPADAKLASIFAAHIAPSVHAHIAREADEKARRLTAIGQMMSAILHDMKTPLANISGYVDFMVRQDEREKREQSAAVVARQVDALTHMCAEILQFARGQSSVLLLPTDLSGIIAEAVALLKPEAEKRRIELRCEERFEGKIPCDADKIRRLIVNLARNAFEAIDRGGHVTISTQLCSDNRSVCLTVADDGPGIPKQIATNLFDAFVTVGKANGTGLGLSIVKKIVSEHEASISWENLKPRGTAFRVVFKGVGG